MSFTVTSVRPFTVAGVGPIGEFTIEKHGYHPQAGQAFHYRDGKYQFYFYVDTKIDLAHNEHTITVTHFSGQLFRGIRPEIEYRDASVIQQNIQQYFEAVSIVSFDKIEPPTRAPEILFEWMRHI
jgi:hypothetical protein